MAFKPSGAVDAGAGITPGVGAADTDCGARTGAGGITGAPEEAAAKAGSDTAFDAAAGSEVTNCCAGSWAFNEGKTAKTEGSSAAKTV